MAFDGTGQYFLGLAELLWKSSAILISLLYGAFGKGVGGGGSKKSQEFFKSPAALYVRVMWTGMCCVCLSFLHADTYWNILVRKTKPFFISFWELYVFVLFHWSPTLFSLFLLFGTLVELLNAGLILWFSFLVLWFLVLLFWVRCFLHTLCQSFIYNILLLFLDKMFLCFWRCYILCLFVLFYFALSLLLSAFFVYFDLLCLKLSWRSLTFFIF